MANVQKSCVEVIYTTEDGRKASVKGFFMRAGKHKITLESIKKVIWSLSSKVYEVVDFGTSKIKIPFGSIKFLFKVDPINRNTQVWDDGGY